MIRTLFLIALLVALAVPVNLSRAAQPSGGVEFTFADGTRSEDEAIVRIGIQFAREFFASEFGVEVSGPITVDVRGTQQYDVIAYTAPGELYIATGAMGWHYAPALRKLQTVIHEYVHLIHWQEDPAGTMPLWLVEGSAEYLAWYAIDRLGLLDLEIARDFWIGSTVASPVLAGVPLSALERPTINGSASVYEIGAYAVSQLVDRAGVASLFEYIALAGGPHQFDAFAAVFGLPLASFYAEFESARASAWPVGYDVTRLLFPWYPSADVAEISDALVWSQVTRGGLSLVQATTEPGTECTLAFHPPDGSVGYSQAMRANADGSIFWLWPIAEEAPPGDAWAEITCGLNTLIVVIEVE